jgi:hypothetical protein
MVISIRIMPIWKNLYISVSYFCKIVKLELKGASWSHPVSMPEIQYGICSTQFLTEYQKSFFLTLSEGTCKERATMSDDIKFYTPTYIPPEILAYEAELLQISPGISESLNKRDRACDCEATTTHTYFSLLTYLSR